MRWLELSATVDATDAEVVAEVLGRFGYGGVAIEEQAHYEGEEPLPKGRREATVRIYLPIDSSLPKNRSELKESLASLAVSNPVELRECETAEEEWETAWRKHYKPLKVGRRMVVKPAWEEYRAAPGQLVIELDPGMAFGTGQHSTTRLCLVALERRLRPGMAVLDLGTGSGILAIAAAKLGAGSVLALDINPLAVKIARGNVQANGVAGVVRVEPGTLPLKETWQGSFDLVVCNITAEVIGELADHLLRAAKPGGTVVVSGFITEHVDGVVARLGEAGAVAIEVLAEGEWRGVVAQARGEG